MTDTPGSGSTVLALSRPPRRAPTIGVVVVSVVGGFVCWYIGIDTLHAAMIGLIVLALGILLVAAPLTNEDRWDTKSSAGAGGSRRDVGLLALSLVPHYGRVQQTALVRLQQLATRRLSMHHLDLSEPSHRGEIETLIGTAAYSTLHPPIRRRASGGRRSVPRTPTLREVDECLDALDRLDPKQHAFSNPVTTTPVKENHR